MKSTKLWCRTRMRRALALSVVFLFGCPTPLSFSQTTWQAEWAQRQEAAKKQGKVVFSIPSSAELRKVLEDSIKRKFGFEVEVVPSAAAKIIRRIADEHQAGVHYFDVIIGTCHSRQRRPRSPDGRRSGDSGGSGENPAGRVC